MDNIIQFSNGSGNNYPVTLSEGVLHGSIALNSILKGATYDIYVAPNGDDSNDGSNDFPIKSIEKAIELVDYSSFGKVNIYLKSGKYSLSSTLNINFPDKKICVIGEDGAEINGLQTLNFSLNTTTGLYEAACNTQPMTIFANGSKILTASTLRTNVLNYGANLAVCPAVSSVVEDGVTYYYFALSSNDIAKLIANDKYKYIWMTIYKDWTTMKYRIIKIVDNNIYFRVYPNSNGDTPIPAAGSFVTFENMEQTMDIWSNVNTFRYGSFYYDASKVYYKAKQNETVSTLQVPFKGNLMSIHTPVTFFNVKFKGVGYEYFDAIWGCSDTQGGYAIRSAIETDGKNVNFLNCEFSDIEQTCIGYLNGASYGTVDGCHFHNCGCSSVRIGELDNTSTTLPKYCVMKNCLVAYMGELHQMACGVVIGFADHCRIEHNEICLCPYSGITAGHIWTSVANGATSNMNNCSISYNYVRCLDGGWVNDVGMIYTLGDMNGMDVIGNIGHHLKANWSNVLYLDNGSGHMNIKDNILSFATVGISMGGAYTGNIVKNNIVADCNKSLANGINPWTSDSEKSYVENNILCNTTTNVPISIPNWDMKTNIFYSIAGTLDISLLDASNIQVNPNLVINKYTGKVTFSDKTNANIIGYVDPTSVAGILGHSDLKGVYDADCKTFIDTYFS